MKDIKENEVIRMNGVLMKWEKHKDTFLIKSLGNEINNNYFTQIVPDKEALMTIGEYDYNKDK